LNYIRINELDSSQHYLNVNNILTKFKLNLDQLWAILKVTFTIF